MQDLLNDIRAAVEAEYIRAAAVHGRANHSSHESHSIILEEVEEAEDMGEAFREWFGAFWRCVKCNECLDEYLLKMRECAEKAAAEWVQIAAMCHKAAQKIDDVPFMIRGSWERYGKICDYAWRCSICNHVFYFTSEEAMQERGHNYCPQCGANMEEVMP